MISKEENLPGDRLDDGSRGDETPLTAVYQECIAQRREALGLELGQLLPPKSEFVWEVGCGHGHFLTGYAQSYPGQLCVGVDVVLERVERANRKRNRAKLPQLHFLRAEANLFLEALPADACVRAIYVLFPDPWPKRRHHKHRLMGPAFLKALAKRAGEAARLYFRTDYTPYFREVEALLQDNPDWQAIDEVWPFELATVFQQRAASYHSLVARKRSGG